MREIHDKMRGCIFAGALGDALGYAVEFSPYSVITQRYGENGIQELELTGGKAVISDDTQMTLFTMEGMTQGYRRALIKGIGMPVERYVCMSYEMMSLINGEWERRYAELCGPRASSQAERTIDLYSCRY